MTKEELFSQYVEQYPCVVPAQALEQELSLILLEEKQRMQYEMLTGTAMHLQPQMELDAQMDALREIAQHRAKESLVLDALLQAHDFSPSSQELLEQAQALAQRQNTTVAELKKFFGDDLSLLYQDLCRQKAITWACAQLNRENAVIEPKGLLQNSIFED